MRKRPLVLTEAGLRFSQGARAILEIHTGMLRDIAALGERQRHKLTLAVSTFEAPPFLPELLAGFTAVHPEYEISVVKRPVTDIASHMDGVDLFFSFLPLDPNLEHIRLIEKDRLALAVRQSLLAQHFSGSLSSLRQELAEKGGLALLRQMPFILPYDRKGDEIPLTRQLFRRAGFSPVVGFQSDSGDLNTSMCLRGFGTCSENEYIETALYLIITPNTGLFFAYCSICCGFSGHFETVYCVLSLICRLNLQ